MTTPETTTPETHDVVDSPDTAPEPGADNASEAEAEAPNPNREAARYRTQLREAEAALETANARIEAMNRREVERLASDGLSHPSDIFTMSGNDVSSYLNDSGSVDPEKVAADVAAILLERPGLKPNAPAVDRSQGLWSEPAKPVPSWDSFLQD